MFALTNLNSFDIHSNSSTHQSNRNHITTHNYIIQQRQKNKINIRTNGVKLIITTINTLQKTQTITKIIKVTSYNLEQRIQRAQHASLCLQCTLLQAGKYPLHQPISSTIQSNCKIMIWVGQKVKVRKGEKREEVKLRKGGDTKII